MRCDATNLERWDEICVPSPLEGTLDKRSVFDNQFHSGPSILGRFHASVGGSRLGREFKKGVTPLFFVVVQPHLRVVYFRACCSRCVAALKPVLPPYRGEQRLQVVFMQWIQTDNPLAVWFLFLLVLPGVLTGATKAQNAKIAGKFDGHLRLTEGLNVTSSGEAKGVRLLYA